MDFRQFLEQVVRPNLADYEADFGSERKAFNAVLALDALPAHLLWWCKTNAPTTVTGLNDDDSYRAHLAAQDDGYSLVRDIAKAVKHVELYRGNPAVRTAAQIEAEYCRVRSGTLWWRPLWGTEAGDSHD